MNLGENIALLRKENKMTQEQLAEKCGVSRQAVTKWESGESEPTIARVYVLMYTAIMCSQVSRLIMQPDTVVEMVVRL